MKSSNYINEITIVLVTYKSSKIILDFVKQIPREIKVIIIDNSNDTKLKHLLDKYKNIELYFHENNGFATSLNYASTKVKTKYFFQVSPDINFNFNDLKKFYSFANEINDKFTALGPNFIKEPKKNNLNENLKISKTKSIHGSVMFINLERFIEIGKFDEKIFLYFEETDYCKRGFNKRYYSYQFSEVKVDTLGRTVDLIDKKFNTKLDFLTTWHFIWSKFYFYKKHYGFISAFIFFIPILIRIIFRINLYKWIFKNSYLKKKYTYRLDGLLNSIKGKRSSLRIEDL